MPDQHPTPHPDTVAFMDALWGAVEPEAQLVTPLWTLQGLASHWRDAADPAALAQTAANLTAQDRDVYVSVSAAIHLPPEHRRSAVRISADNSAGIVGLWADIDIADPDVHKKWNLPPDEDSARLIVERMGLKPSIVVNSGHGLQVWWLFHEFWVFDSEDDRRRAAGLSEAWNRTMAVHAAKGPDGGDGEQRWTVDMTFDLSRVMRIPGTLNRKGDPVVPVRLLEVNDARYSPEDFDEFLLDESVLAAAGLKPLREYQVSKLVLRPDATISVDLLEALQENERFTETWEKKRRDFLDGSGSIYDMALASMAANLNLDDQTIADLLIHFRRKHGEKPEKALRMDYMQRTIAKARDTKAREEVIEILDDIEHDLRIAHSSGDQEEIDKARRKAVDAIGNQLGIEITKFVRYMSEPPSFRMVTPSHTVELGGPDDVLKMDRFKSSVWSTIGYQIPRFKTPHWDRITAMIPSAWVEQDVGYEATETGETEAWLVAYLQDYPPVDTPDEAADQERAHYLPNGRVAIFGAGFRRHLAVKYGEKVRPAEINRRLQNYGCVNDKVNMRVAGKRTSKSVWVLPDDWKKEES